MEKRKNIQNGREPKKSKMEDDQKIQNRRQPKKSKWKTTKKIKTEDNQKKIEEKIKIEKIKVNQYNLIKNDPIWLWHRSG